MIQCPECRSMIPDDSAFCDQCGKELKWCPECKKPKRGTECPVCGSELIPGRKYLSAASGEAAASPESKHQPTAAAVVRPVALAGNGWRLMLQQGEFGRAGGIWPQLASCPYVSGRHGIITDTPAAWKVSDRGSTNGTFLNGIKLNPNEQYDLKKGDRVRIATLDFTVE